MKLQDNSKQTQEILTMIYWALDMLVNLRSVNFAAFCQTLHVHDSATNHPI